MRITLLPKAMHRFFVHTFAIGPSSAPDLRQGELFVVMLPPPIAYLLFTEIFLFALTHELFCSQAAFFASEDFFTCSARKAVLDDLLSQLLPALCMRARRQFYVAPELM